MKAKSKVRVLSLQQVGGRGKVYDKRWTTGPTPSSASHYRGGRCSVGLHTLGLDWEANDVFHFLSGLGNRARRVTDDTNSGTRSLGKFLASISGHSPFGDHGRTGLKVRVLPIRAVYAAAARHNGHLVGPLLDIGLNGNTPDQFRAASTRADSAP
jgi:hypothetical protein